MVDRLNEVIRDENDRKDKIWLIINRLPRMSIEQLETIEGFNFEDRVRICPQTEESMTQMWSQADTLKIWIPPVKCNWWYNNNDLKPLVDMFYVAIETQRSISLCYKYFPGMKLARKPWSASLDCCLEHILTPFVFSVQQTYQETLNQLLPSVLIGLVREYFDILPWRSLYDFQLLLDDQKIPFWERTSHFEAEVRYVVQQSAWRCPTWIAEYHLLRTGSLVDAIIYLCGD